MPTDVKVISYPSEGLGAPKNRTPSPVTDSGLPVGTEIFSSDNHISLSEDIFYERFPESMKDRAPRVVNAEGAWVVTSGLDTPLHPEFLRVLTQYDPLSGSHTGDLVARLAALDAEGVHRELAFPNAVLGLVGWPDREVRELAFRIYNDYIADLQHRSGGRVYGVGIINWWDPDGAKRTVEEAKALGLKTVMLPLFPGKDVEKKPIDYASSAMDPLWAAIEDTGLPVSFHIGENPPLSPNEFNALPVGMIQSVSPFRDIFGKLIFGGILDRHPGLQIGFFEAGINWVPSALQDAEHIGASFRHLSNLPLKHDPRWYWQNHMCASFIVDPLGLELIHHIGVERAMWSTDFPHNESTWGYSNESLASVVATLGPEAATAVVSTNIKRFLGVS
jgi:predicted TIM-barrel fold metal-dependent hydrolase